MASLKDGAAEDRGADVIPLKRGEATEAEKPAEEEKPKALEFENLSDATRRLVKALDAEDRAVANRKKIGEQYRDSIKQAEDKLTAAIDGARASTLKDLGTAVSSAKEAGVKARSKMKDARAAFAEKAAEDDGDIGKAYRKLEKIKTERATAKATAAESIKRASGKAELIRYSIHEAAGQLRLDL
jgi:flagellar biosynthesis chaperone FliJ